MRQYPRKHHVSRALKYDWNMQQYPGIHNDSRVLCRPGMSSKKLECIASNGLDNKTKMEYKQQQYAWMHYISRAFCGLSIRSNVQDGIKRVLHSTSKRCTILHHILLLAPLICHEIATFRTSGLAQRGVKEKRRWVVNGGVIL